MTGGLTPLAKAQIVTGLQSIRSNLSRRLVNLRIKLSDVESELEDANKTLSLIDFLEAHLDDISRGARISEDDEVTPDRGVGGREDGLPD